MNLKNIISGIVQDKLGEPNPRNILPLDAEAPKKGWKVKAAGILAVIATIAGTLSQFLGG